MRKPMTAETLNLRFDPRKQHRDWQIKGETDSKNLLKSLADIVAAERTTLGLQEEQQHYNEQLNVLIREFRYR